MLFWVIVGKTLVATMKVLWPTLLATISPHNTPEQQYAQGIVGKTKWQPPGKEPSNACLKWEGKGKTKAQFCCHALR